MNGATRPRERGMTIIEVMITLTLMVIIFGIFYELVFATTQTGMLTEGINDLSSIGQRAVNTIQSEVRQAKLVMQENSIGTAYRTLFTSSLPSGTTVWTNSRMPIIDGNTMIIGPDPGPNSISNRTGNTLLVVRQLSPVAISYDHDNNSGTANINFMADRYQFELFFLRQNTSRNFGNFGYYVDLMQARSQIVADYFQLNSIAVNRAALITGLRALSPQILLAWDPGKALSTPAFYNLNSGGTMTGNSSPTFNVTVSSLLPEFRGGRVSGKMEYSVSLNSSSSFVTNDQVPEYATANSNFPGGFECMVVGGVSSRKVLTRLVLAVESRRKFRSQEALAITAARGF